MAKKDRLNQVKHHLAVLAKRKEARIVPVEVGTKWWFGTVLDPRTGRAFTYVGAWGFIAERLREKGTVINEITLSNPPGRKAYELRVPTNSGTIYIKVHFGQENQIVGRSFHY